jgi:hypothetical protein
MIGRTGRHFAACQESILLKNPWACTARERVEEIALGGRECGSTERIFERG